MYDRIRKTAAAAAAAFLMLNPAGVPAQAADEKPLALMCLGDSITDGFWMQGGYRNTLCSLITEAGYADAVDFVGPNWGGSGYDPQHAGYSGYSIDNIAQEDSISGGRIGISSFIDKLLADHHPDVVFMQIGTNDILSLYDLEHFGERLEKLTDTILAALPADGILYLATLPVMDANNHLYISEYFFTVESMDQAVESCNAQIRAIAQKKQAEGKPIRLAEINKVLTKDDLFDGVHPSEAGYAKMGQFWFQTLNDYRSGAAQTAQTTEPVQTTETTQTTVPAQPQKGDVNLDGVQSIADAVTLAKALTTEITLTEDQAVQADMDENRKINAVDLTLLKRAL